MADNNVIYTVAVPEVPKVIPGEQLYVYVPRASFTNPGIAKFNKKEFTISADGLVSLVAKFIREEELNKDQFAISDTGEVSIKDTYVTGVMKDSIDKLTDAIDTANDTANNAEAVAETAKSIATNAETIAKGIEGKADSAIATANDAKDKAEAAQQTAEGAMAAVDDKLDKSVIVQGMGNATDKVISQKVVTDALDTKVTIITGIHGYDQVYGRTAAGSQTLFNVSDKVTTGAIVRRKDNGQIVALEATTNDGVVNLGQLTTKLLNYLLNDGSDQIFSGDLAIQGDLTVRGTTITTKEETLNVKDAIVVTNADGTDLTATLAGFVIRLNATDCYGIMYDHSTQSVKLGKGKITDGKFTFNAGEGNAVAVRADGSLMTDGHLIKWDATALKFVDAGKSVDDIKSDTLAAITEGDNISITKASDSEKIVIEAEGLVKKTTLGNTVYCTNRTGENIHTGYSTTPVNNYFPLYNTSGILKSNDPTNDLDCVNLQYANNTYMPKTPIQLNNTDVVKTITVEELLALKSGFYSASNCILKGNTTDLPQGYYHIIKNNATVHNGDGTFIAQEQDSGKTYAFYSQLSGSVTIGWHQLASTDDITRATAVLIDSSFLGG
mgnify:FL=1